MKIIVLILAVLFFIPATLFAQIEFIEHIIISNYPYPSDLFAADIDGDGDIDILTTSTTRDEIVWLENEDGENFARHIIVEDYDYAVSVYGADIDSDDDTDVIGAARNDMDVRWWENDNQDFTEHEILEDHSRIISVSAVDFNNDEHFDVITTSDEILLWLNDGNENFDTQFTICDNEVGLRFVSACDLDDDGDYDIIGGISRANVNEITWWENEGIQEYWNEHTIEDAYNSASYLKAVDLDSDDDNDIIGTSAAIDDISWWENDGNLNFTRHIIADDLENPNGVFAVDLDLDGDIDLVNVNNTDLEEQVVWWDNDGDQNFTNRTIVEDFSRAKDILCIDMDDDGDDDVVVTFPWNNTIAWWENRFGPEPPDSFNLTLPLDGDTMWSTFAQLQWEYASDPNPFDTAHYDVWIDSVVDLSSAWLIADSTEDTTLVAAELPDDHTFYWTVRATDSNTPGSWANDTLMFSTYLVQHPDSFSLIQPEHNYDITRRSAFPLSFQWQIAFDPDPDDHVNYTFMISENSSFFNPDTFPTGASNSIQFEYIDLGTYWWRVRAIDRFGMTTYSTETWVLFVTLPVSDKNLANIPDKYSITSLYPNPFNPSTSIVIGLPEPSILSINVFNIFGQQATEIASGHYSPGYYQFTFDGSDLSSGIYFIHASVPGKMEEVRKIVLMK